MASAHDGVDAVGMSVAVQRQSRRTRRSALPADSSTDQVAAATRDRRLVPFRLTRAGALAIPLDAHTDHIIARLRVATPGAGR